MLKWLMRGCLLLGVLIIFFGLLLGVLFQALSAPLPGIGQGSGPGNQRVVASALAMAQKLYNCPPENFDQCWLDGFPQEAIDYWQHVCPGCSVWQNGNLQCVEFVTAAYAMAGQPLPIWGNAVDFWTLYSQRSSWLEIPSGSGPPLPGDMMVLASPYFGGVGHIAIVVDVQLPAKGRDGSISIAQANGPGAINTFSLPGSLIVTTWTNFTTLGFIRHR